MMPSDLFVMFCNEMFKFLARREVYSTGKNNVKGPASLSMEWTPEPYCSP